MSFTRKSPVGIGDIGSESHASKSRSPSSTSWAPSLFSAYSTLNGKCRVLWFFKTCKWLWKSKKSYHQTYWQQYALQFLIPRIVWNAMMHYHMRTVLSTLVRQDVLNYKFKVNTICWLNSPAILYSNKSPRNLTWGTRIIFDMVKHHVSRLPLLSHRASASTSPPILFYASLKSSVDIHLRTQSLFWMVQLHCICTGEWQRGLRIWSTSSLVRIAPYWIADVQVQEELKILFPATVCCLQIPGHLLHHQVVECALQSVVHVCCYCQAGFEMCPDSQQPPRLQCRFS